MIYLNPLHPGSYICNTREGAWTFVRKVVFQKAFFERFCERINLI